MLSMYRLPKTASLRALSRTLSDTPSGLSHTTVSQALNSTSDARSKRKQEIFQALNHRNRSTKKPGIGDHQIDAATIAIFNQQVTSTAGEILADKADMMREIGHESVAYFSLDTDSLQTCAQMMRNLKIGAALVVDESESLRGIITERDFVKAATDQFDSVGALMTPIAKLVHVGPESGLGECLELMRTHQVRHLPVLCNEAASETSRRAVAAAEVKQTVSENKLNQVKATLLDALGHKQGTALIAQIVDSPSGFMADERPACQRVAEAIEASRLAEDACAEATLRWEEQQSGGRISKGNLLGVISVKDALLTVTKTMLKPLADYAEEERMREIEERVGYSE